MKLSVINQVAFRKRNLITVVAFMLQLMVDNAVGCGAFLESLSMIHQIACQQRFLITVVALDS